MNSSRRLLNIVVVAILVAGGTAGAVAVSAQVNWDAWKPKDKGPVSYPAILIEPAALHSRMADDALVILDARTPRTYAKGHLPGAVLAHVDRAPATVEDIRSRLGALGLTGEERVVCYGGAGDALALGNLFWMLEVAGLEDVEVLHGGWEAWERSGFDVSTTPTVRSARQWRLEPVRNRIADRDYVRSRIGTGEINLLDWRPAEEWARGHVPHSLPFPLQRMVAEDGSWLEGKELRAVFAEWGPRPREYVSLDAELVVLGSDPAPEIPAHPYLGARLAGIEPVRFYPGGSTAWNAAGDAPWVRMIDAAGLADRLRGQWNGELLDLAPPDLMLFDLRERNEFEAGHLPGSVWLPASRFEAELEATIQEYWPGADRGRVPVVVYCYGPSCTRSRNCSTIAARRGFNRLFWFKGGVQEWKSSGRELFAKSRDL